MGTASQSFILFAALALLLAAPVAGQEGPATERIWTGKNGSKFRGSFVVETDGKLMFISGGKTFLVEPQNLSAADREWLTKARNAREAPVPATSSPVAVEGAFLADPVVKRSDIPIIDQSDYGNKASDCVPSSICNFLLWWDQIGYLPIDRRGDFDDKAEWVHDVMGRLVKTRNTAGTSTSDTARGVRKYFDEHLKSQANCQIILTRGVTPAMLAHYCRGPNASALAVTTYYGRRDQGGHFVALTDADAAGGITIHTWGQQFKGKLKLLSKYETAPSTNRDYAETSADLYAIEFDSATDLPDWMIAQEVSFQIDPAKWDGLFVIVPARYSDEKYIGTQPPPYALHDAAASQQN